MVKSIKECKNIKLNKSCKKKQEIFRKKYKKPYNMSFNEWLKSMSTKERKEHQKLRIQSIKCAKSTIEKKNKCYKTYSKKTKKNEKCCVCKYVKSGKTLRRVKGRYGHCSYDSNNCCKDKKSITK